MTQTFDDCEGHHTEMAEDCIDIDQVQHQSQGTNEKIDQDQHEGREICIESAMNTALPSVAFENNDEIPPTHDSPKNIINILNNDCIQEVLRLLKNMRDFVNAASVCTRFQENAKECFPSAFKNLRINDADDTPRSLPSSCVPAFLRIFGHFIQSIEWSWTQDQEHDDDILNTIAEFCGKTLTELTVYGHKLNFNTASPFEVLEKLELYDATIYDLGPLAPLKSLKLTFVKINDCDWLAKEFPNLQEAKFYAFHKLRDQMLTEFLRLNPQLQSLELICCRRITTSVFQNIGTCSPNLTNIGFEPCKGLQSTFDTNMVHLSDLRKLKSLHIECHRFSGKALLNSLAENCVPIENLIVEGLVSDLRDCIPKLSALKKLSVSSIFEAMLIEIAGKLNALEEIRVRRSYDVTLCGIRDTLELAKNLSRFSIHMEELTMDLEDYYSVLALAGGRTQVELFYKKGEINVTEEILNANRKWLNIEKY